MILIDIFLILNLALSIYLILQHRLLNAIIAEGVISSLSAALFFLLKAPDIAITQVAIGSGFLTFLFIVSIKIKEKVIVAYCEESALIYENNGNHYGISVEILSKFAKIEAIEIEYRRSDCITIYKELSEGKIDIIISAYTKDAEIPRVKYLETERIILKKGTGTKQVHAYGTNELLKAYQDPEVSEIMTILPSLIFIRNRIKGIKMDFVDKKRDVYFYINPYNSDLMDYLKKFVNRNQKLIEETVDKYA